MKKKITNWLPMKWQRTARVLMTSATITLAAFSSNAQVIVGTGTSTARNPFNFYYGYGRDASIYTAAEMNTATVGGTITTLSWYSGSSSVVGPVTIYLKTVGTTTAVASANWATTIAGATTVYTATPTAWTSNAWNVIDITDFAIPAGQNLAVLVETNVTGGGSGGTTGTAFRYTTTGSSNHAYWSNDTNPPTGIPTLSADGAINANRPNITFGGLTAPTCLPPTAVTVPAATITTTGATINWTAPITTTPATYEYEVRTTGAPGSGSPAATGTVTAPTLTATVSTLAPATAYTVYVRSNCGGTDNSTWTAGTAFTTAYLTPANNEASGAIGLAVNADYLCGSTLTGYTNNATASTDAAATCAGANDDVWYSFTATAAAHRISFTGTSNTMVAALYTGTPALLTFVTGACASTTLNATGLSIGTTYYVRAYTSSTTLTTFSAFTICVGTAPPPPANDECAGAIAFPAIPTDGSCVSVIANTASAIGSAPASCTGTPDDDVWYSFVCPTGTTSLLFANTTVSGGADRGIQFFSGTCASLTSIACSDPETGSVTGLTPGDTYYFRIYEWYTGVSTEVSVCLSTPPSMNYVSSTNEQTVTSDVSQGSSNQQILRTQVVVSGSNNALNLTQLDFNTAGTTNASDIISAKVFYTGSSTTFSTATPFGSIINNPNGNFSVVGNQVLAGGTSNTNNYFWLVYDVACTATVGNTLDASNSSVVIGAVPQTPTQQNPTGSRAIVSAYTATNVQQTGSVFSGSINQPILRVALTGCINSDVTSIDFSTAGTTVDADITAARVFYTATTTFSTATQFGSDIPNPAGPFSITGSLPLTASPGYFWLVYDVNSTATAGNLLDAECSNATINGINAAPGTVNPTGSRAILTPLVNDNAPGAISLTLGAPCTSGDNTNASQSIGEPYPNCNSYSTGHHTVWYSFQAPASGNVKISTDYPTAHDDTKLGLFSATNVNDYSTFTIISCDEDNGVTEEFNSIIYATNLIPTQTYYIQVDGWSTTNFGTFCISVEDLSSTMLSASSACASTVQDPISGETTYTGQVPIVDDSGNLVAIVRNAAGGAGEDYTASQNINTAAVREDAFGLKYLDRNVNINNATATNVEVTLFFLDTELATLILADPSISSISNLNVSHTSGSCSNDFNSSTSTLIPQSASGSTNGVSWIRFNTPNFSNFFIHGGTTPLPVKLASFTGKNAGTINVLNWKTTEEKNFSHFELQRSKDGATFHKLAVVNSNKNAMGSDYAYNDERPFEGKNFYRLNMVDVDGLSVTSEVVELMVKAGAGLSVNVYPNPVSQQLNVEVAGKIDGTGKVIVTDIVGKTVRNITMTGNTATVDMNNLPSGIYMIKYSDNSHSSVIKITKD